MIDIIAFLGLLSVIMIFANIGQANKFNIYLGFFFLSLSSFIIGTKILTLTQNYYIISLSFVVLFGILMTTGPMLYFYTLSVLGRHKKNVFYYLHYLPIVLMLINLLPFFLKSREYQEGFQKLVQLSVLNVYKIDTLFFPIQYFFLFRFVSGIFYALWCFMTTYRSKHYFIKNKKIRFLNNYYWILYLSGFLIINFSILFFSIMYLKFFSSTRILSIEELPSATFASFLFGFGTICAILFLPSILFNPRVIYFEKSTNSKSKKKNQIKDFKTNSLEESLVPADHEINSRTVNLSNFTKVAEELALYFYGKPYLQPGFNLSIITNETDIPYHKVTSYFTVYLGLPFNDWKNDMRVEHAIELIKHGQAKNKTIESIAYSCGYLSRSNFVNSFKKKTGLTPSEYIKTIPEGELVVSLDF
jgi:AraC-like DNA-binding protein